MTMYLCMYICIFIHVCAYVCRLFAYVRSYVCITGVGSGGGGARGTCAPPTFLIGGAIVCLCPPTFNPTFLFST